MSIQSGARTETMSCTLGLKTEHNPYSGELVAIASALETLAGLRVSPRCGIDKKQSGSVDTQSPYQQSGQGYVCRIYDAIRVLGRNGNLITILWIPTSEESTLLNLAKERAKAASRQGAVPQTPTPRIRSTTLNVARRERSGNSTLPEKVGRYSKKIDAALPGKHTRTLYDQLSWKEASVLAQLRTGMTRLNAYLHQIKAAVSGLCACGQARETVEHFLFRCTQWTTLRAGMLRCTDTRRSNISFYLGREIAVR